MYDETLAEEIEESQSSVSGTGGRHSKSLIANRRRPAHDSNTFGPDGRIGIQRLRLLHLQDNNRRAQRRVSTCCRMHRHTRRIHANRRHRRLPRDHPLAPAPASSVHLADKLVDVRLPVAKVAALHVVLELARPPAAGGVGQLERPEEV
jgi:hypothetical protein